jgi:hypothetical protein
LLPARNVHAGTGGPKSAAFAGYNTSTCSTAPQLCCNGPVCPPRLYHLPYPRGLSPNLANVQPPQRLVIGLVDVAIYRRTGAELLTVRYRTRGSSVFGPDWGGVKQGHCPTSRSRIRLSTVNVSGDYGWFSCFCSGDRVGSVQRKSGLRSRMSD